MNCKKISLYVLIAVAFSSCCYIARCPGFNLDDHCLIPYRYNDTLYYYSDNLGKLDKQDSLVLVVVDFDSGESHEFFTCFYPDVECGYEVYYQTNEVDGISIKEYVYTPNDAEIQIGDDFYPSRLGLKNTPDTTYLHDSTYNIRKITFPIMIDNIEYNCWTMEDLTGNYRFDSFTKMEYKGIVEFHDRLTGKTWRLKD